MCPFTPKLSNNDPIVIGIMMSYMRQNTFCVNWNALDHQIRFGVKYMYWYLYLSSRTYFGVFGLVLVLGV